MKYNWIDIVTCMINKTIAIFLQENCGFHHRYVDKKSNGKRYRSPYVRQMLKTKNKGVHICSNHIHVHAKGWIWKYVVWPCAARTGNYQLHGCDWLKSILTGLAVIKFTLRNLQRKKKNYVKLFWKRLQKRCYLSCMLLLFVVVTNKVHRSRRQNLENLRL